ncbi:MAG: hypothetical protein H0V01_09860 [Bacteroidetes bacterium]|nr:hypothetical protein [Bacteroidota bacterium]HET6244536.1 hypothetical protein [Bacteroidia bacterium]
MGGLLKRIIPEVLEVVAEACSSTLLRSPIALSLAVLRLSSALVLFSKKNINLINGHTDRTR